MNLSLACKNYIRIFWLDLRTLLLIVIPSQPRSVRFFKDNFLQSYLSPPPPLIIVSKVLHKSLWELYIIVKILLCILHSQFHYQYCSPMVPRQYTLPSIIQILHFSLSLCFRIKPNPYLMHSLHETFPKTLQDLP
jgi:hypothetical protein